MSTSKKLRAPAAALLVALTVYITGALSGCSTDAIVKDLGFVEASWTIKGLAPSTVVCAGVNAKKVRIQWGDPSDDNPPQVYECKAGKAKRAAGDGTKLQLTLELLGEGDVDLDRRTGSALVKADDTATIAVDFFGSAQPDAGVDGGADGGADAAVMEAGTMEAGPDSATVDAGAPEASTPDASTSE